MRSTVLVHLQKFVYSLFTFAPGFQVDHSHSVAGTFRFCHQTVTCQSGYTFNLIEGQQGCLNLIQYFFTAFHSRSRRGIHIYIHHSLVFVGNKSGRQDQVHAVSCQQKDHECGVSEEFTSQVFVQSQIVTPLETVISPVKHDKELAQPDCFLLTFSGRTEKQGTQGR